MYANDSVGSLLIPRSWKPAENLLGPGVLAGSRWSTSAGSIAAIAASAKSNDEAAWRKIDFLGAFTHARNRTAVSLCSLSLKRVTYSEPTRRLAWKLRNERKTSNYQLVLLSSVWENVDHFFVKRDEVFVNIRARTLIRKTAHLLWKRWRWRAWQTNSTRWPGSGRAQTKGKECTLNFIHPMPEEFENGIFTLKSD